MPAFHSLESFGRWMIPGRTLTPNRSTSGTNGVTYTVSAASAFRQHAEMNDSDLGAKTTSSSRYIMLFEGRGGLSNVMVFVFEFSTQLYREMN
jgi:cation transport regulator ChaC